MISVQNHRQPLNGNNHMTKKGLTVVLALLFTSFLTYGQTDYEAQYTKGKQFFRSGQYNLAMESFKLLTNANPDNPYGAYASYYYAIAAYREGFNPMAKSMFLQIKQRYPRWNQIDEVNLWLGKLHFENDENLSALRALQDIQKPTLEVLATSLKQYELRQIDSLDEVKSLLEYFPEDRHIAMELAYKIAHQPLVNQDREQLETLISKFDLDASKLQVSSVSENVFKDRYRVAVLLPFLTDRLTPDERKKVNQVVLDLYQGIQLAHDSLVNDGFDIELLAYDTKADSAATARLLQKPEMKSVDLFIGPLFTGPIQAASSFAYANEINMFNPFSGDIAYIANNPFYFLCQSPEELVGKKAAQYVRQNARNKVGVVFSGTEQKDLDMAGAYIAEVKKDSFNLVITRSIAKGETEDVLDLLLKKDGDEYKIGRDSIGHIFLSTDDQLISSKVFSAIETRGDSIMVVCSSKLLEETGINYNIYSRQNIVLYAPSYTMKETNAYMNFRDKFIEKHRKVPSEGATTGYDLMMLLGTSLNRYGKYFQIGWNELDAIPGVLSFGYNYSNSNYNKRIPFLKYSEGGSVEIIEVIDDGDENE